MKWEHFRKLPDESRLWIHGFRNPLPNLTQGLIHSCLSEFLSRWQSHGTPVQAAAIIDTDRFLITAAHCPGGVSGCSMDSYGRALKSLREEHQVDALETDLVFYVRSDGEIEAVDHLDFFALVEQGKVTEDTLVFDTLLQALGDLRQGRFLKPFKDSWHARTYPVAPDLRSEGEAPSLP